MLSIARVKVQDAERSQNKTRVYCFLVGESLHQNLVERFSRPHDLYKKTIAQRLVKMGLISSPKDLSWSQTAGCSCGCSPGFILKNGQVGKEVFIDLKGASNE